MSVQEIADQADMIVAGYAFKVLKDHIEITDLNNLSKTAVIYALFLPALRMIILGSMICRNPVFLYPKIGIFYFMAKRAVISYLSLMTRYCSVAAVPMLTLLCAWKGR